MLPLLTHEPLCCFLYEQIVSSVHFYFSTPSWCLQLYGHSKSWPHLHSLLSLWWFVHPLLILPFGNSNPYKTPWLSIEHSTLLIQVAGHYFFKHILLPRPLLSPVLILLLLISREASQFTFKNSVLVFSIFAYFFHPLLVALHSLKFPMLAWILPSLPKTTWLLYMDFVACSQIQAHFFCATLSSLVQQTPPTMTYSIFPSTFPKV